MPFTSDWTDHNASRGKPPALRSGLQRLGPVAAMRASARCGWAAPQAVARPAAAGPSQAARFWRARSSADGSSVSTAVAEQSSPPAAPEQPVEPPAPSTPQPLQLTISIASGMEHVGRDEWDACATGGAEVNPFLLHDFLSAVEGSGSAVREEGWQAQHVLVRHGSSGALLGCAPMYLKAHSYGEYVFDQSWANAYHRMLGQPYYPKLLVGVPFTPVTGPRLLVRPGEQAGAVRRALADALKEIADQFGVSSLHINFVEGEEGAELEGRGYLMRTGVQYHWANSRPALASLGSADGGAAGEGGAPEGAMYSSFDDAGDEGSFLMALKQSKRKSIRQERKKAAAEGLRFLRLTGAELEARHWDAFYSFYRNTTDRKWGTPYLTRDFFHQLGQQLPDRTLLVLAETAEGRPGHGRPVAGALNLIGSHALFGRNWGCAFGDRLPNLHFELCYYQALEFAIERGLRRVEAGAQGEHKLQRGYLASPTRSAHYLPHPGFSSLVARFLDQERQEMDFTLDVLRQEASPYKQL